MSKFSIFINSTDSFEDCWYPFFNLLKMYWPTYSGTIYLNTEYKDFSYNGFEIVCIKNQLSDNSWSNCLQYALSKVEADTILYLQEDYFFTGKVNETLIQKFESILESHELDCIQLTDQCTSGPFKKELNGDITEIDEGASYRTSLQAALWNKNSLLKLLRKWESPWQFEYYASKRSEFISKKIYCVNQKIYGVGKIEIIPYIFTGIIRGKWNQNVPKLFESNGIILDYSKRGFSSSVKSKTPLRNKIKRMTLNIRSKIDLIKLKYA